MKRNNMYKAVLAGLAATGLAAASLPAAAETHSAADIQISNLNLFLNNSTTNIPFDPSGAFQFNAEARANLIPGGTDSLSDFQFLGTTPNIDNDAGNDGRANVGAGTVGTRANNDLSVLGPGGANGASADNIVDRTFITPFAGVCGVAACSGSNVRMIAEANVQGPPSPIASPNAGNTVTLTWNIDTAGLTSGDTLILTGDVIGSLIAATLNPTAVGDVATASWGVQMTAGSKNTSTGNLINAGTGENKNEDQSGSFSLSITLDNTDLAVSSLLFTVEISTDVTASSVTDAPEPGSLAMMGGGLLLLGAIGRRRKLFS